MSRTQYIVTEKQLLSTIKSALENLSHGAVSILFRTVTADTMDGRGTEHGESARGGEWREKLSSISETKCSLVIPLVRS